jgi:hypothetical protein
MKARSWRIRDDMNQEAGAAELQLSDTDLFDETQTLDMKITIFQYLKNIDMKNGYNWAALRENLEIYIFGDGDEDK